MGALRALITGSVLAGSACAHAGELSFELIGAGHVATEHERIEGPIGGLSGLAFDQRTGHWIAVTDSKAACRALELRIDFVGARLDVEPLHAIDLPCGVTDAEAIAISPDDGAWYIGFEQPASVARFDPASGECSLLALPPDVVAQVRPNRSFENVAIIPGPGGPELWVAVENALLTDGQEANDESGTPCRVMVIDARTGELKHQAIYLTEPRRPAILEIGSFNSLADAIGLPDGRVLFMERGFALPRGAYVVLFECAGPADRRAPFGHLIKSPVADLHDLGVPLLFNIEAMALGPELDDGGRLMILMSDDNFGATGELGTQVIALRVRGIE